MMHAPQCLTDDSLSGSLPQAALRSARGARFSPIPGAPLAFIAAKAMEVPDVVAMHAGRGRSVGTPKHRKAGAAPSVARNAAIIFRARPVGGQRRSGGRCGGTASVLHRVKAPGFLLSKVCTRSGGPRVTANGRGA